MATLNTPNFPIYSWKLFGNGKAYITVGGTSYIGVTELPDTAMRAFETQTATVTLPDGYEQAADDSVIGRIAIMLNESFALSPLTLSCVGAYTLGDGGLFESAIIIDTSALPPTSTSVDFRLPEVEEVPFFIETLSLSSLVTSRIYTLTEYGGQGIFQPLQKSYTRVDKSVSQVSQHRSLGSANITTVRWGLGQVSQMFRYPFLKPTQVYGFKREDERFDCDPFDSTMEHNYLEKMIQAVREGKDLYFHLNSSSSYEIQIDGDTFLSDPAELITEVSNGFRYQVDIPHLVKDHISDVTSFGY